MKNRKKYIITVTSIIIILLLCILIIRRVNNNNLSENAENSINEFKSAVENEESMMQEIESKQNEEIDYKINVDGKIYSSKEDNELITMDKWKYFDETDNWKNTNIKNFVKPDSCVLGISYNSKKVQDGVTIYTYTLGATEDESNKLYHIYQYILQQECGYRMTSSNGIVKFFKGNEMIIALSAGNDNEIGYFLQISYK
jgi:Sec-independent protein translocase protein TatA